MTSIRSLSTSWRMARYAARSATPICRLIGSLKRPSARCCWSRSRRRAVSWSPRLLSHTAATAWPRRASSAVRSQTWRKRPPTGARRQCRMRNGLAGWARPASSQPAFIDVDGVARLDGGVGEDIHFLGGTVDLAGDPRPALVGAVGVAAGNCYRGLHGCSAHVGILAGVADLAQDEERPVLHDINGDIGFFHVFGGEPTADGLR